MGQTAGPSRRGVGKGGTVTDRERIRLAGENVAAWTHGDWERLRAPLAPDFEYYEVGTGRRFPADGFVRNYQGLKEMAPDGRGEITNALACGDTVVLEVTWTGTQTGAMPMPGGVHPPTGRRFTMHVAQVVVFQGDAIREFRQYFDMLAFLQQIGALPGSGEAGQ